MAEKTIIRDMTSGSPTGHIVKFFFPLLMGMLFQQFYNMVDTAIVGKFLGSGALASVGATGSVMFMILGFCMGLCNGFSIPISQAFGAKDYKLLRKYFANSIWLYIGFSVIITLIVCLLCRNILVWMDTPKDIIEGSYEYLFIIFLGIPVLFLYDIFSGIMRALGDSKHPLVFLVISSVLNIGLDIVAIPKFGVAGAAYATVISQLISGILCLIFVIKKFDIIKVQKGEWKPSSKCISRLCAMGIPMGLQYSITAIGSIILQTAVNRLGSDVIAAITAGGKINMFLCCPFDAMGTTMATYTGQNLGAQKYDRIDKGILSCSGLGLAYSVFALVLIWLLGQYMAMIFINAEEVDLIEKTVVFMRWNSAFYFPLALVNIVRFTIQGLGFGKLAILAGVCEMIARGLVGFFLIPAFGFVMACIAGPAAWIFADAFLIPAYILCMRYLRKRKYEDFYR